MLYFFVADTVTLGVIVVFVWDLVAFITGRVADRAGRPRPVPHPDKVLWGYVFRFFRYVVDCAGFVLAHLMLRYRSRPSLTWMLSRLYDITLSLRAGVLK